MVLVVVGGVISVIVGGGGETILGEYIVGMMAVCGGVRKPRHDRRTMRRSRRQSDVWRLGATSRPRRRTHFPRRQKQPPTANSGRNHRCRMKSRGCCCCVHAARLLPTRSISVVVICPLCSTIVRTAAISVAGRQKRRSDRLLLFGI